MLLRNVSLAVMILSGLLFSKIALAKTSRLSDEQVKQQVIDESIASYPGVCACPFNSARNGSSCGKRSAWSKAGGYSPVCYTKEVTRDMVAQWRQGNEA